MITNEYYEEKCIYKQNPEYYARLNIELLENCDWCPFDTDCKVCGGLNDVLMGVCYDCNKCKKWGNK